MASVSYLRAAFALSMLSLVHATPLAQEFPSRGIRIVVPFPAGGGTDVFARLLAVRMQESLGQTIVVDNRAGAAGNIGTEIVVKSAPDGHTLLLATASIAINVTLYPRLAFDARKDLVAVSHLGSTPSVLTVHPSVPARNARELVELSKKTKGGLNFGSNGAGTAGHLAAVMFRQASDIAFTHIPYKGAAPAMTAALGGEIDFAFPAIASVQPMLRSGRLRALAVSTKRPAAALPDVPTLDSSYPGIDITNWFVMFAPARTPAAIVSRINTETIKAMQHPDVKTFMQRDGVEYAGTTPAQAAEFLRDEVEKLATIVKAAGLKAE